MIPFTIPAGILPEDIQGNNPLKLLGLFFLPGGTTAQIMPLKYHTLSTDNPEELDMISNGCGPKGHIDLVPDSNWGLDISGVCKIHDVMYEWGTTRWDKFLADIVFLVNHVILILQKTNTKGLTMLRCYRAVTYFNAVFCYGDAAFFKDKN